MIEEIEATLEHQLEIATLPFGNQPRAPATPRSKLAGGTCSHH
ncbi:hypothetical protein ACFW4O_18190 [Streptomyces mutabilis]|nr:MULTISPECIES: hypothetical protein [unclassified Streptomyces]MDN3244669.1 hypothetical protein [Streptomyces sp. ZSW22]MDQ0384455.1 hypothetical protein [Streptomyces sp. DSM 42143]